jgi:hypothetical protein
MTSKRPEIQIRWSSDGAVDAALRGEAGLAATSSGGRVRRRRSTEMINVTFIVMPLATTALIASRFGLAVKRLMRL